MKRLKLRSWVKVVLFVLFMWEIFSLGSKITNDSIQKCVDAGNSQAFCEKGLK